MKKFKFSACLLLSLALLFSSCSKKTDVNEMRDSSAQAVTKESSKKEQTVSISDFYKIYNDPDHSLEQLKKFADEHFNAFQEMDKTAILEAYDKDLTDSQKQRALVDELHKFDTENEVTSLMYNDIFSSDSIDMIKNDKLKTFVKNLYDLGYFIQNSGNEMYIVPNYSFFDKFQGATKEWDSYKEIQKEYFDDPAVVNGAIVIDYDKLGDRILKIDKHLTSYLAGYQNQKLQDQYHTLLSVFMLGTDSTSVFNKSTQLIYKDALTAYEKIANMKDTATGRAVAEYLKAIKSNNMKINDEVSKTAVNQIGEAVRIMREHK